MVDYLSFGVTAMFTEPRLSVDDSLSTTGYTGAMSQTPEKSRREFLGTMFRGAAQAAVVSTGVFAGVRTAYGEIPELGGAYGLLGEIPVGVNFSGSWQVTAIYPPVGGGMTLNLQNGPMSRPIRVDMCLRTDPMRAPAATYHYEFFVMNGGKGKKLMDEGVMAAIGDLADIVSVLPDDPQLRANLLLHDERWSRHPEFMGRAAFELQPRLEAIS
jgi:hypothetical protein